MSKVLIIDDAETMRRAVTDALSPAGFTVVSAPDGFRGIAALKEMRDLSLVIIDLNMPGMSGFGVLDWMRKDGSAHLPPAVFMTTEVSEATLSQAKKAGAVGWLVKPCRAEQLVAVVSRVVAKRSERHGS
ncbi:MAG: response regulator [Polyangiaceae bacterium]|jgi:two-component system chemotaxis response regulator CheY|nr:response regulator [Polyangiaceae bacterium]